MMVVLVWVELVKVILEISGCCVSVLFVVWLLFCIMLKRFGGMFVLMVNLVSWMVEYGVSLDGLSMIVLLVVSVVLIFYEIIIIGKFYGVIVLIML